MATNSLLGTATEDPAPMSEAFAYAVGRTLTDEGVWSDHPRDRGGKTKFGITEELARRYGYNVRELTRAQALVIYEDEFWDRLGLAAVSSRWVAAEIFDTAVNMGPEQATLCAQRACNLLLEGDPLRVDGRMGPLTRATLNRLSGRYHRQLLAALNGFQFVAYLDIHRADPVMAETFVRGWMRRLTVAGDAPEAVAA